MYNNLGLQLFLCHCFLTNVSAKKNLLKWIKFEQINVKCYNLLAKSKSQQLYRRVHWLAPCRLHSPVCGQCHSECQAGSMCRCYGYAVAFPRFISINKNNCLLYNELVYNIINACNIFIST